MMKNAASFKKFQFFDIIEGDAKSNKQAATLASLVEYSLADISTKRMRTLSNYVFLSCKVNENAKSKQKIPIPSAGKEMIVKVFKNKLLDELETHNKTVQDFEVLSYQDKKYLFVVGTDKLDIPTQTSDKKKKDVYIPAEDQIQEISSLKIFDITNWVDKESEEVPKEIKKITFLKIKDLDTFVKAYSPNQTQLPINNVTCFDISDDGTSASIGCENGDVIIITAKTPLLETNENSIQIYMLKQGLKNPITNLKFSVFRTGDGLKNAITFSTEYEILYYIIDLDSNEVEVGKKIEEDSGVMTGCLSMRKKDNTFFIADNDFICEYMNFDKGRIWGFDGHKKFANYFKNYATFVICEENVYSFSVYDQVNQIFIYHSSNFNLITGVCCDEETIFILTENDPNGRSKSILRLKEKDNKEKFDTFYKKSFFDTAYNYAKNLKYDQKKISEISKRHAEHLYKKGEYEKSIEQYIKTINFLDPSYVIQKFLDGSKLDFLIKYLEALNKDEDMKLKAAPEEMKDYTALLLNCYIKQKEIQKLKEFVGQKDVNEQILVTAIEVCKDTKNTDLALSIAEKSNMTEAKMQILMDNGNFDESISVLEHEKNKLKQFNMFIKYGGVFLEKAPEKAMNLLEELIHKIIDCKNGKSTEELSPEEQEKMKAIDYETIVSIFITDQQQVYLQKILEIILREDQNCPALIVHRMIEFYLEKIKATSDGDSYRFVQQIKDLLRNEKYEKIIDKNYLLMLFKIYNQQPCITELSEIMELRQELLQLYMENHNYEKIIEVCRRYGQLEINYWIQALNYFVGISTEGTKSFLERYIKEILTEVSKNESLSPLLILSILKKSKNIQLITVKEVLSDFLKKTQETYTQDKLETNTNYSKIEKLIAEEKELKQKAKTYAAVKCSICSKPLTMPYVYFLCNHAFHSYCLSGDDMDEMSCSVCRMKKNQLDQRILQSQELAKDHNSFFTDLKSQSKKFNLIGKYLGKGIFDISPNN